MTPQPRQAPHTTLLLTPRPGQATRKRSTLPCNTYGACSTQHAPKVSCTPAKTIAQRVGVMFETCTRHAAVAERCSMPAEQPTAGRHLRATGGSCSVHPGPQTHSTAATGMQKGQHSAWGAHTGGPRPPGSSAERCSMACSVVGRRLPRLHTTPMAHLLGCTCQQRQGAGKGQSSWQQGAVGQTERAGWVACFSRAAAHVAQLSRAGQDRAAASGPACTKLCQAVH